MPRPLVMLGCLLLLSAGPLVGASRGDANRFLYLEAFWNPYYVGRDFPKLVSPQWAGATAVITLGIDDMREPARYEAYLRPILERLKAIDGRTPVSIMTCQVDPSDPLLARWLDEGLSLETHTIDHPCPCLAGGDFERAKATYDRCVDLMHAVPGNRPVAFRFPCCDSLNTPSPRAYAEILGRTTPEGHFLQISSSVCSILDSNDPQLPASLTRDADGRDRFAKYVPFPSFVNKVYNYPYPFVIGRRIWEFPCAVPDDWQGNNLHQPRNPQTVADMQAVVDAVVKKRGTANFVFHPYDWIRGEQMAQVVDYADRTYGSQVVFLTFKECLERLNRNALAGHPLRSDRGDDNGVRLLDLNTDGYLDVVVGNPEARQTRIWDPQRQAWEEGPFPVALVEAGDDGALRDAGVRWGVLRSDRPASLLAAGGQGCSVWHFDGRRWERDRRMERGLEIGRRPLVAADQGRDRGVRLVDVDGDGVCEVVVGNPETRTILQWDAQQARWKESTLAMPEPIVDSQGRDAGLRWVDLDGDGHLDIVFSNHRRYSVTLFASSQTGWSRTVRRGQRGDADAPPMIARQGTNNGAWFAEGFLWVQNEDTQRLPDGVDRSSFAELLGGQAEAEE